MTKRAKDRMHQVLSAMVVAIGAAVTAVPTAATEFTGTLYYTKYTGGANVWKVDYFYDNVSHAFSLTGNTHLASTPGADGIIFAPNGNLLIGGQCADSGSVYEVKPSDGSIVGAMPTGACAYHLTLDPGGGTVYTSDFGGSLKKVAIPIGSGVVTTPIVGAETGITQVAFGTGGATFYVQGFPNGGGNLGTIDLSSGATTRLYAGVEPAHGLLYDPFTSLITMFGHGHTGTMSASDGSGLKTSDTSFACDFDQGAVTGTGIALVAGCDGITLIDYTGSGDITSPDHFAFIGHSTGRSEFLFIDDVAPLVGAGSECQIRRCDVPEPAPLALVAVGLIGAALARRRPRLA